MTVSKEDAELYQWCLDESRKLLKLARHYEQTARELKAQRRSEDLPTSETKYASKIACMTAAMATHTFLWLVGDTFPERAVKKLGIKALAKRFEQKVDRLHQQIEWDDALCAKIYGRFDDDDDDE